MLYFIGGDDEHGSELYRSDGTAEGTVMVKEIYPGPLGSFPTQLTAVGKTLYFRARTPDSVALHRSDGTAEGTVMVKDIHPDQLTALAGVLYFTADDGVHGTELYRSDGTAEGTMMVRDIRPRGNAGVRHLARVGDLLLFFATDGVHGLEPYASNGTSEGTGLIADIFTGPHGSLTPPIWQSQWALLGDRLFFSAADATYGAQLWAVGLTP